MAEYRPGIIPPPGQARSYPEPSKTGTVPFRVPGHELKSDTKYWIWGELPSDAVPLICLHGGPGMTHDYILPICLIHEDFKIPVIMYDQIGCGQSTHFPEKNGDGKFWTPELFMAELDNFTQHLGITTFDLLGQSWGGMLAGQYAIARQPKGLRKLIISNSPSDLKVWLRACNRVREGLPKDVQETLTRCEREDKTDSPEYEAAVGVFNDYHLCRVQPMPKEISATLEQLKKDPTVYHTMNGPNEFYVIGTLKDWGITDDLHKITPELCPGGILVINGLHDEAQDETTVAFFTRPTARTRWVQFALSSHTPMLEETERYIAVLGAFLQSN